MINDVWALEHDAALGKVIAETMPNGTAPYVVLMHNRAAEAVVGALGGHYGTVEYASSDIVEAVGSESRHARVDSTCGRDFAGPHSH